MERLRREIRGFSMEDTLTLDKFKVVEYFPYTSIVTMRIVETNSNHETLFDNWLKGLWESIEKHLHDIHGIMPDNKVAVRLVIDRNKVDNCSGDFLDGSLYVGYKDGKISIGLGVWQPDEWTKKYNRVFN